MMIDSYDEYRVACGCPETNWLGSHWKLWHILDGQPVLTMDVRQNNYLLPLAGESWEVHPYRQARINLAIRWERSPEFHASFVALLDYFSNMTCRELIAHHKVMGIQIKSDKLKRSLVATAAGWWYDHLQELSKPVLKGVMS